MHFIFPTPTVFSNSSGLMLASHAISRGRFVVRALFSTASMMASFLGVHPSKCLKYTEKMRNPPLTFTHAWAIIPSFPGIDSIAPFSAPTTAPSLLPIATKTPRYVSLRSSSPAVSSVILDALAANLHPSSACLLDCSSISSCLNLCSLPKKISHADPFLIRCVLTSLLFSFQSSQLHLAVTFFSETFLSACPEGLCHPGPLWCF